MKNKSILLGFLLIGFFVITRLFIWIFRPTLFTEIIYNYMPFAHLWASGVKPYLNQWYEYPPGTIPLFFIPHLIDKITLGLPIHLEYLQAYRGILLLVDVSIFVMVWKMLRKYRVSTKVFAVSLVYYSLVTAKAHHFMYDTMDLTFTAAMTLAVAAPMLIKGKANTFVSWLGTFLATALKIVNAPLTLVYAALERNDIRKLVVWGGLAFLVVWLVPLGYFRSSLQVSLVYHQMRGLQVESAPAVISSTINAFTKTESSVEVYKNYDITGPVSVIVKQVFDVLFYLGIAVFLIYGVCRSWNVKRSKVNILRHQLTLLYIFVFMVLAKVLSSAFLLWHIPFLAMYPFKNVKQQLKFLIPSLVIIIISMTRVPNLPIFMFNIHLFIGWAKHLLFIYLLVMTILLIENKQIGKTKSQ